MFSTKKMVRIRFKTALADAAADRVFMVGEVADVPVAWGRALVAGGAAEAADGAELGAPATVTPVPHCAVCHQPPAEPGMPFCAVHLRHLRGVR
jgi:mono/diheme cytochrome c family protein